MNSKQAAGFLGFIMDVTMIWPNIDNESNLASALIYVLFMTILILSIALVFAGAKDS